MEKENLESEYANITNALFQQAVRLFKIINENLNDCEVKIKYDEREEKVTALEFLNNSHLQINVKYDAAMGETLNIEFYKIYPPNNYQTSIFVASEMELFKLFPKKLLDGLRQSYTLKKDLVITL